jgi:hypothetical protein
MAFFFRTYRTTPEGIRVDGVFAMAFIHNGSYHLTHISIYEDGLVDCWGLVPFEDFKDKVRSGWVVTQPPPGAPISVIFLGSFTAHDARFPVDPEEFIKEVKDEIERLNGRPTSARACYEAWQLYNADPSGENEEALRIAYEAVPEHLRRFVLGDMDSKDHPIRRVLYPEEY